MNIYDISQEVLGCEVYPGAPSPRRELLSSLDNGDPYTLSAIYMCAHNGTHIDAPAHFINGGDGITDIALGKTVGYAYVARFDGDIGAAEAEHILEGARASSPEAARRILIGGKATVTNEGARVFASSGILLLGNESQTVGPEDAPMAAHVELLSKGVVLLEGIRLSAVPEGVYLLFAAPLAIADCDGSPCRALLVDIDGK